MFFIARIVPISIAALLIAACTTVQIGRDFDMRTFEMKVERGVTTQNQVRAWLGAPTGTGVSVDTGGERFEEWTYYSASGKLPDMAGTKIRILQIKFDQQGIVRGYYWSTSDQ